MAFPKPQSLPVDLFWYLCQPLALGPSSTIDRSLITLTMLSKQAYSIATDALYFSPYLESPIKLERFYNTISRNPRLAFKIRRLGFNVAKFQYYSSDSSIWSLMAETIVECDNVDSIWIDHNYIAHAATYGMLDCWSKIKSKPLKAISVGNPSVFKEGSIARAFPRVEELSLMEFHSPLPFDPKISPFDPIMPLRIFRLLLTGTPAPGFAQLQPSCGSLRVLDIFLADNNKNITLEVINDIKSFTTSLKSLVEFSIEIDRLATYSLSFPPDEDFCLNILSKCEKLRRFELSANIITLPDLFLLGASQISELNITCCDTFGISELQGWLAFRKQHLPNLKRLRLTQGLGTPNEKWEPSQLRLLEQVCDEAGIICDIRKGVRLRRWGTKEDRFANFPKLF